MTVVVVEPMAPFRVPSSVNLRAVFSSWHSRQEPQPHMNIRQAAARRRDNRVWEGKGKRKWRQSVRKQTDGEVDSGRAERTQKRESGVGAVERAGVRSDNKQPCKEQLRLQLQLRH